MLTEEEVLALYRPQGVVEEGALFLELARAREFVATCRANELAVIGVEGFVREGGMFEPRPEWVGDFVSTEAETYPAYLEACGGKALEFLDFLAEDECVWANLLVFSEGEWAKLNARRKRDSRN